MKGFGSLCGPGEGIAVIMVITIVALIGRFSLLSLSVLLGRDAVPCPEGPARSTACDPPHLLEYDREVDGRSLCQT